MLDRSNTFLATAPAPLGAKRWALAICSASFVVFCALIPFARVSLPRIEAFVPIYDSMFALNNLLTAGGLVLEFSRSRSAASSSLRGQVMPAGLRRFLCQHGVSPRPTRKLASPGRGWWCLGNSLQAKIAMNIAWFYQLGLINLTARHAALNAQGNRRGTWSVRQVV